MVHILNYSTEDTVKDLFIHPESEGPLGSSESSRRQMMPVEFNVKKTNARIAETHDELMKCEERLKQLQLQHSNLNQTAQTFNAGTNAENKYLGEEQKQIFSGENEKKSLFNTSAYNKRFGYATVYDNKYKNIATDPNYLMNDRKSTLSNAGTNLISQNPNLNLYKHKELQRSSPFGSTGDSAYSKMTSSSAYGGFFKK